ncbi:MAG: cytochrome c [Pseudomonadota bacterium]
MIKTISVAIVALGLTACEQASENRESRWTDDSMPAGTPVKQRWYTREQVTAGARHYQENCASCHKENAEGTADWKTRDSSGKLPPPPLNGTGHAWHHPLAILRTVVKKGGIPVGGTMPAFGEQLDEEQIDAILAWVQSHWSDEIYALWRERDGASRSGP